MIDKDMWPEELRLFERVLETYGEMYVYDVTGDGLPYYVQVTVARYEDQRSKRLAVMYRKRKSYGGPTSKSEALGVLAYEMHIDMLRAAIFSSPPPPGRPVATTDDKEFGEDFKADVLVSFEKQAEVSAGLAKRIDGLAKRIDLMFDRGNDDQPWNAVSPRVKKLEKRLTTHGSSMLRLEEKIDILEGKVGAKTADIELLDRITKLLEDLQ